MLEWICVLVISTILRSMKPSSLRKLQPPSPRLIWLVMVILLVARSGGVQLDVNGNNNDHSDISETNILISVISLMSLKCLHDPDDELFILSKYIQTRISGR